MSIDFSDIDEAGFEAFAEPDCLYTPPVGGTPVEVRAVMSGGDTVQGQLGGAGFQAPSIMADLLLSEVASDPSPVRGTGGGELAARIVVPTGPFAGTYSIRNAAQSRSGGTWRCALQAAT